VKSLSVRLVLGILVFAVANLFDGAVLTAQPLVYVTNLQGQSVSVVDPSIGQQIATIPVGLSPYDVAVTPDGSRAYVSLLTSTQIKIIDTATNHVSASIPFQSEAPAKVVFSADGTRAYVPVLQGSIYLVNTATLQRIGAIHSNDANPFGMALAPDGSLLYVSVSSIDAIKVIDTATFTLRATVFLPVGTDPRGIAFSPAGDRLYVAGERANNVSVLSVPDNTLLATIAVGASPNSIGVVVGRSQAYVTTPGGNSMTVIDLNTNAVIATIPAPNPNEIVITADEENAYFTNTAESALSILDLATNSVVSSIPVGNPAGDTPKAVALGRDPGHTMARVFVGLANSDDVGIRFDLRAEVYVNGVLVASGQANSVAGGSSGFSNARLNTISLAPDVPIVTAPGDTVSLKLLVRNACAGSGKNSGRARLWYNDSAANSRFHAILGAQASNFFLQTGLVLATQTGTGPQAVSDVTVGAKCGSFQPFGAWDHVVN
jgi:YVTN family beta-propeller protein